MKYYFCDTDKHTKQVLTDQDNPVCNHCGGVMTYGRFTKDFVNGVIVKAGLHTALDGSTYQLGKAFVVKY